MYPDPGSPAPGMPVQNAPAQGPVPGMPTPGIPMQSAPLPGTFPGGPVPMGAPAGFPSPVASSTGRRPRNWHLALGGALALGILAGILSPSGVLGFAWSIATLAALGAAAFFGLKRAEEYRQQRQNVDLARGFAATVPPGQEGAVPTESLALVAGSATAAATRIYGDRHYLFGKPPAEAEAEAAAMLAVANRAKVELSRRGVDPTVTVAPPVAPTALAPAAGPTGPAPVAGYVAGAAAAQPPAPDAGITKFILKHSDEETW